MLEANESGGNQSSTTIVGCFSGCGLRDRECSQRDTRALCEPAAGRLHLGYIHTDALVTSSFSERVTVRTDTRFSL